MLNRRDLCLGLAATSIELAYQHGADAQSIQRSAYVYFEMGVSDQTMRQLQDALTEMVKDSRSTIYLLINSSGGSVSSAIAMYHWIIGLPVDVYTYALSDISSAAIILFLAGKERIANSGSRFGFHSARHRFQNADMTPAEIKEAADDLAEDNQRMIDIFTERMKLSRTQANDLLGSQIKIVRSKEAAKIGLITKEDELHVRNGDRLYYVSP